MQALFSRELVSGFRAAEDVYTLSECDTTLHDMFNIDLVLK